MADVTTCICRPTAFRKSWAELAAARFGGCPPPDVREFIAELDNERTVPLEAMSLLEVARHEASHAIAAIDVGAGVQSALIQEKGTVRRGLVYFQREFPNLDAKIMTTLAGHAATVPRALSIPDEDLRPHVKAARSAGVVRCDVCVAMRDMLQQDPGASDVELIKAFREHEARAAAFVHRPDVQRRIGAVAQELLVQRLMAGEEILAVLRRSDEMTGRRIELPEQYRKAELGPASFRKDDNSIEVVFTTGATVRRRGFSGPYDEELIVTPETVRLDRLNSGAPFLNTHSDWSLSDVIGSVVPGTAKIAKGVGTARIMLSKAAGDADIVQKIKDGVIRSVSVGYSIHRVEVIAAKPDGVPTWRVVDWEPYEISAVPVPADAGATIRSARNRLTTCTVIDRTRSEVASGPNLNRALRMRMKQRMISSRVGYP